MVPLGPLINFIASSIRIPITSIASLLGSPTLIISSPDSILLSFHKGPPSIISTISIPPSLFCNLAPIPSNLPEILTSKRSLSSGLK